ncbi:hypothetical protein ACLB1T_32145 [Escherichia coli]
MLMPKADALRNNWNAGLQEGLTNSAAGATDYASQAADAALYPRWTGWYQIFPMHWPGMLWSGGTGGVQFSGKFQKF